jgi:hypothetical protein
MPVTFIRGATKESASGLCRPLTSSPALHNKEPLFEPAHSRCIATQRSSAEVEEAGRDEDALAYLRGDREFHNVLAGLTTC